MLEIKKDAPPEFFNSWKKNKVEFNHQLREHVLEKEQSHLCCYCEKAVTAHQDKSHIEPIRPKDKFPKLKNDYNNLAVSCETNGRCGKAKGSRFTENFIVPTEENPASYLTYSFNGEIKAIDGNRKGEETIDILNLNSYKLVKARRAVVRSMDAMRGSNVLNEFENYFKEYPTFIEYLKESISVTGL